MSWQETPTPKEGFEVKTLLLKINIRFVRLPSLLSPLNCLKNEQNKP